MPTSVNWLKNKTLKAKYEKLPLSKRRHLSLAAHKFAQVYDDKIDYWYDKMIKDSNDYKTERNKNKKSLKESRDWIDDALKKLKKSATEFKRTISHKLRKDPSIANLWLYTQYLLMRFYSEIQLRNDLGTIELTDKKDNNLLKKVKGQRYDLIMRQFKSSNKIGPRTISVSAALSKTLKEFIKYRNKVDLTHDFLIINSKGLQLSKSALGKTLRKLTKDKLSKSIGTRMLRIFNATENAKILEKASEISHNMLHSAKQAKQYVRK